MMHTATILSPGYSLPSAKLPGLTRDTNIPGSPCIKLCPFPPSSLIPSLVDLSLATEKKYIYIVDITRPIGDTKFLFEC